MAETVFTFILFAMLLGTAYSSPYEYVPISVNAECYQQADEVLCQFDYTNVAQQDYYLLKRNTPLEGLYYPYLTVKNGEQEIEYEGRLVSRLPPVKSEYVLLQAGSTISSPMIQLTQAYKFPRDGLYSIEYTGQLAYLPKHFMAFLQDEDVANNHITTAEEVLASAQVVVTNARNLQMLASEKDAEWIQGLHLFEYEEGPSAVGMADCKAPKIITLKEKPNRAPTANQEATLIAIHKSLCNFYSKATDAASASNKIFKTWFNTGDPNTAKQIFLDSLNGLLKDSVLYRHGHSDCDAAPNINAVTTPGIKGSSRTVDICPNFYVLANDYCNEAAAYTREMVLVHEFTHSYSSTKDTKYGIANCKQLAINDPAGALNNADNYGFHYCEAVKHA